MNQTEPQSYQDFEPLPARVLGILRSPRAVFRTLIDRPRWADVLILSFGIALACGVALMSTEVGRQALVDQWERTELAFGRPVDDAEYGRLQDWSAQGPAYAAVQAALAGPVLAFGLAAVLYGVFTGVLGGAGSYRQNLAVVAHAGVILAVRQLIVMPLAYVRETLASPLTPGRLFPMLDEASPAARFLGVVDVVVVWWVVVLAIGVSLLYARPARRTALAFVGAYVGVAALLAIAMVLTGGTV
jgi:hypothetical protein